MREEREREWEVSVLGKNRDRVDIVAAVLEAANSGANKTRIMNMARLSFVLLEKYLGVVLGAGFVRIENSKYMLTERGKEFIRQYRNFDKRFLEAQRLLEALDYEREKLALMCEDAGSPVNTVL